MMKSLRPSIHYLTISFASIILIVTLIRLPSSGNFATSSEGSSYTTEDRQRLEKVLEFADQVLAEGTDRWSGQNTPLLADGIHIDTRDPVVWRYDDNEYIIHNLANQQNLFRVLTALTRLTGEERYQDAAKASIQYHFDHLISDCGKLRWGGHQFIELQDLQPIGHFDANTHEFKTNFPFYELMWEVDPDRTAQFIRALWEGHIRNWENLTMNRHAGYGSGPPPSARIWEKSFLDPEPFFEAPALSFLNCGSDLIFAGGTLFALNQEEGALRWAKNMAGMYTKARHPETGMGTYQYTKPSRRQEPPAEGPLEGRLTYSSLGDRTENQFGRSGSLDPGHEDYNPVKNKMGPDGQLMAREGWMARSGGFPWYAIIQLHLAEILGDRGMDFAHDAADHLEAHAYHSYVPEDNLFLVMWADGTDVTGLRIPRTGYHGQKGRVFQPRHANMHDLMTYARAYRITGRASLWETARHMATGLGLGDIGIGPGHHLALNLLAPGSDYQEIFAMLELYKASGHPAYLERARIVADRVVADHFIDGFFMPSRDHVHARFDRVEPLALLALDAVLRGKADLVPPHIGSSGYIHGRFDGFGRTTDSQAIWAVQR